MSNISLMCSHPLKGFIVGITKNGKQRLKIRPYKVDHVEVMQSGQYIDRFDPDVPALGKPYCEFVTIPCGRCASCRLRRAKDTADRCVLELQEYDSNLFLTLTYNDDNLPHSKAYDENGNIIMNGTLVKKDLQNFWKRLRKYTDSQGYKIRYLACGEYGSWENTHRPHYHAIVFNLKLPDLIPFTKNEFGDILYTSKILDSIWKNGYCLIGEATHQSIEYVARYVVKKQYGKNAEIYEKFNIEPEFSTCSRRPGLARNYYEKHKEELFNETTYSFPTRNGSGVAMPGRYFNNLFESDFDSVSVAERKNRIKDIQDSKTSLIQEQISQDYVDFLDSLDYIYNKRQEYKLKRVNDFL